MYVCSMLYQYDNLFVNNEIKVNKMKKNLDEMSLADLFSEDIDLDAVSAETGVPRDLLEVGVYASSAASAFLSSKNIGEIATESNTFKINSGFDDTVAKSLDVASLKSMVEGAKVPEEYQEQAIKSVARLLQAQAQCGDDFMEMKAYHEKVQSFNGSATAIKVGDILPAAIANQFDVNTEAFGHTANKVTGDLHAAVTVTLLKWHNTLTPRLLQNVNVSEPFKRYIREQLDKYGLNGNVEDDVTLVDMYADPSSIANELKRIIVKAANNPGGDIVVADDVLKFGVNAKLIPLSVDAATPGYTAHNRTDVVAEGATMQSVRVQLAKDTFAAETFVIDIPKSDSRFTRMPNQGSSTIRGTMFDIVAVLDATSKPFGSADASLILADSLTAGDKVVIKFSVTAKMDSRQGDLIATISQIAVSAQSADNGEADAGTDISGITTTEIGYTPDARHSEENMRKADVALTTRRDELIYEVAQGRQYLVDTPKGGENHDQARHISNLYNAIRMGHDYICTSAIEAILDDVSIAMAAYAANPIAKNRPGMRYAAGGRVRPTTFSDTFQMSDVVSLEDATRMDSIAGRAITYLNYVVTALMTESFYEQQLDDGTTPVFRLLTSGNVLANVLGIKPSQFQYESKPGIRLALKLPCGAILECITTVMSKYNTKMAIIPFIAGSASDLNFGHNLDYGTIVASFPLSDRGATVNRTVASVREQPIPTCPVGAIIDVAGIDEAVTFERVSGMFVTETP